MKSQKGLFKIRLITELRNEDFDVSTYKTKTHIVSTFKAAKQLATTFAKTYGHKKWHAGGGYDNDLEDGEIITNTMKGEYRISLYYTIQVIN